MDVDIRLTKLITDIRKISLHYRTLSAVQLNSSIVDERWEIGKRIIEEEQNGEIRAKYGANLLKELSKRLSIELGKGYAPGLWHIIANSIYISPTERFCRRVCKISHGLIFRLFFQKKTKRPGCGI